MKKLRIVVPIIGSKSDLPQCNSGLLALENFIASGQAQVPEVILASQHRNTLTLQGILAEFSHSPEEIRPDVIITAAGWANHLSGCVDAFLRATLRDENIVTIGVALEDSGNDLHGEAAKLSVSQVPGTQCVFDDGRFQYFGEKGFALACMRAVTGDLPKPVYKTPKMPRRITLLQAIEHKTLA